MSAIPPYDDLTDLALSPDSSRALDRLAESGFEDLRDADHAAGQHKTPHSRALRALLNLLDAPTPGEPALLEAGAPPLLVDVTMARVMRQGADGLAGRIASPATTASLTGAAARDFDAFVQANWTASDRDSAAGVLSALLSAGVPAPSAQDRTDLVERTLALVEASAERSQRRFRMTPVSAAVAGRIRPSFRWSDLISIAAMLLIGSSILYPMLAGVRHQTMETACAANLSRAASAFTMYAADNDGSLPQAQASFLGGPWWNVGQRQQSHSANLYRLVSGSYASLADLACPGNRAAPVMRTNPAAADWANPDEVSYSFQLMGPGRPQWNKGSAFVVLVDRSPIVPRARLGEAFDPMATSPNHQGRGQHVLFSDGAARFLQTPVLTNGDNLWLPQQATTPSKLSGRELPTTDADAFVGP
jgi:hypothetical protein